MEPSFTEYTVIIDNYDFYEFMVHIDQNNKIIRVYTYRKDVTDSAFCYLDKNGEEREKSFNCFLSKKVNVKNPLFVDLNRKFIDLFREEIMEAVNDQIDDSVEEEGF